MSLVARTRELDEAAAFLTECLDRPLPTAAIATVMVPAPLASLEHFLAIAPQQDAMLWDPRDGSRVAGVGVAARVRASGRDRFTRIARDGEALLARVVAYRHDEAPHVLPRLWGGFAFVTGGASETPWSAFGDADFVLPRWQYQHEGSRAWLTVAVDGRDDRRNTAERVTAMLRGLAEIPADDSRVLPGPVHLEDPDRAGWHEQIDSIRRAIHVGTCQKVVAARCTVATAGDVIDPLAVLAELESRYADCHRFAFRRDGAMFVGATPEILIRRAGARVETEALAGSIALPAGDAAALLASNKDRGEQDHVVRAIKEALAPRCAELHVPNEPRIRALRHVLHLETPIKGVLREADHVLSLANALHPTPAVGGVPTVTALHWISTTEAEPRGWYAGPVGWFDGSGDGVLVVAIRSGLLAGRRAYVYAGAGIVRDSVPDAELDETCVKQRAILGALGVRG